MNAGVNCLDYRGSRDPAYYEALAKEFAAKMPHFGASMAQSGLTCAYWRAESSPLTPPRGRGAPPILVIGTTGDPATPYEWAVQLTKQLESATLLTFNGEGHTAYTAGDECVNNVVNSYLLPIKTPAVNP